MSSVPQAHQKNEESGKDGMPLRRLGKKSKEWLAFRRRYLKNHPPNHEGFYTCYICKRWIPEREITLDHVKSRSRHPELVFDEDNIRLACFNCNTKKGSKDLWQETENQD